MSSAAGEKSRWARVTRRLLRIFLPVTVVWVGVTGFQPAWAFAILETLFPRIVWRVETMQPLVALSFDDGPAPRHTIAVLDILARHHAKATFFSIGSRAAAHPWLIEGIKTGGHEIGNHYLHESTALGDSPDEFLDKVRRTDEMLGLDGTRKLFRPPGGLIWPAQLDQLQKHGYACVLGSAYPYDAKRPPVAYIRWLVKKNLRPGAIVILHDGIADPSKSIAALDDILTAGESRGLRFVTVGELLAAREE